jgi:membrane protease YdiL (CAAX protease family)
MKNTHKLILGLLITVSIYFISVFFGKYINPDIAFFPKSFGLHTIMLFLSILAIISMKKHLDFNIKIPKIKDIWKPILIAILATILINISINILAVILGAKPERHPLLKTMNLTQVIIFVFFYASIAEEFLFRGFLLNILKPYKRKGITILKRHVSLPVIISGLSFGVMHLGTVRYGVGATFLIQIVIFASILGIIAGYYYEKYNNFSYAIIIHMSGNFVAVFAMFVMNLVK